MEDCWVYSHQGTKDPKPARGTQEPEAEGGARNKERKESLQRRQTWQKLDNAAQGWEQQEAAPFSLCFHLYICCLTDPTQQEAAVKGPRVRSNVWIRPTGAHRDHRGWGTEKNAIHSWHILGSLVSNKIELKDFHTLPLVNVLQKYILLFREMYVCMFFYFIRV